MTACQHHTPPSNNSTATRNSPIQGMLRSSGYQARACELAICWPVALCTPFSHNQLVKAVTCSTQLSIRVSYSHYIPRNSQELSNAHHMTLGWDSPKQRLGGVNKVGAGHTPQHITCSTGPAHVLRSTGWANLQLCTRSGAASSLFHQGTPKPCNCNPSPTGTLL